MVVLWKLVFNARDAVSGILPRSMNSQAAGKVTWKTARFAANPMCCGLSTILRRANSSSRPLWNKFFVFAL